jgi:hypothetical protein
MTLAKNASSEPPLPKEYLIPFVFSLLTLTVAFSDSDSSGSGASSSIVFKPPQPLLSLPLPGSATVLISN